MGMEEIMTFLESRKGQAFTKQQLADALGSPIATIKGCIRKINSHAYHAAHMRTIICNEEIKGIKRTVARHFYK